MTTALDAIQSLNLDRAYKAPITVACRRCTQPRGAHCTSPAGNNVPFHPERKADVEHLSPAQKTQAVNELIAERHAAVTAPLPPLTADQQATRAATSRAWDAINKEVGRGTLPVTDLAAVRAIRRRAFPVGGGAA